MTIIFNTFNQGAYRFRNDDGNETTATWKLPAQTHIVFGRSDLDVNFRLRIGLSYGGTDGTVSPVRFRYSVNGTGFVDANATSPYIRVTGSAFFTDDDPTTDQLGGGGVFIPGYMNDTDGLTPDITWNDGNRSEFEVCLQAVASDLKNGDSIEFSLGTTSGIYIILQPGCIMRCVFPGSTAWLRRKVRARHG